MSERDDLIDRRAELDNDIHDLQEEMDQLQQELADVDNRIEVLDETDDADDGRTP